MLPRTRSFVIVNAHLNMSLYHGHGIDSNTKNNHRLVAFGSSPEATMYGNHMYIHGNSDIYMFVSCIYMETQTYTCLFLVNVQLSMGEIVHRCNFLW